MSIVQTSDFTGEYAIAEDCFTDLSPYITKYEEFYLVRMLGAELYKLFIADLTVTTPQVPQTQRFIDIFDPFQIDDDSWVKVSEGIKTMLVQFIYFHFLRDQPNKNTTGGTIRTVSSLGENLGYDGFNLIQAYNEGVKNYHAIQWFICDNEEDYEEENIQPLSFTSGI